jgi:hypothetical protein
MACKRSGVRFPSAPQAIVKNDEPLENSRATLHDSGDDSIDVSRVRELVTAAASLMPIGSPARVLLEEALAALEPTVATNVVPFRRGR